MRLRKPKIWSMCCLNTMDVKRRGSRGGHSAASNASRRAATMPSVAFISGALAPRQADHPSAVKAACRANKVALRTRERGVRMASTDAPAATGGVPSSVRLASPFGLVSRDPNSLPPMVLMAVETGGTDQKRFSFLRSVLEDQNSRSSQLLAAVTELRFFDKRDGTPLLVYALQNITDELARAQIVWTLALWREGEDECWKAILNELADDTSPTVCSAAAGALGELKDTSAVEPLVMAYENSKEYIVQMSAVTSLGAIGDERIVPKLIGWLSQFDPVEVNTDTLIVQSLIGALGDVGVEEGLNAVLRWTKNRDMLVRHQVAEALVNFRGYHDIVQQTLEELSRDRERTVSLTARRLLDIYKQRHS